MRFFTNERFVDVLSGPLVEQPRSEPGVVAITALAAGGDGAVHRVVHATRIGRATINGEGRHDPRAYTVVLLVEDLPATEGGAVVLEGKTSDARARKRRALWLKCAMAYVLSR